MKKQIVLAFALLIAATHVPAQATKDEAKQEQAAKIKLKREKAAKDMLTKGLDIFGGSSMFLIGSWLVWTSSFRTVIDAVQYDKNAALAEADRRYQEAIAQPRQAGDLEVINRYYRWRISTIEDKGTFGFSKLFCTAAGISLIYMGYKELTYKESNEDEPAKA